MLRCGSAETGAIMMPYIVIIDAMIRTQVSITEEQAERLRALAVARNVSQAFLVRQALDALLAQDDFSRRLRRARRPIGVYRSGHSTTAVRHDEALDDAFSV